jgi:hypothetical protein
MFIFSLKNNFSNFIVSYKATEIKDLEKIQHDFRTFIKVFKKNSSQENFSNFRIHENIYKFSDLEIKAVKNLFEMSLENYENSLLVGDGDNEFPTNIDVLLSHNKIELNFLINQYVQNHKEDQSFSILLLNMLYGFYLLVSQLNILVYGNNYTTEDFSFQFRQFLNINIGKYKNKALQDNKFQALLKKDIFYNYFHDLIVLSDEYSTIEDIIDNLTDQQWKNECEKNFIYKSFLYLIKDQILMKRKEYKMSQNAVEIDSLQAFMNIFRSKNIKNGTNLSLHFQDKEYIINLSYIDIIADIFYMNVSAYKKKCYELEDNIFLDGLNSVIFNTCKIKHILQQYEKADLSSVRFLYFIYDFYDLIIQFNSVIYDNYIENEDFTLDVKKFLEISIEDYQNKIKRDLNMRDYFYNREVLEAFHDLLNNCQEKNLKIKEFILKIKLDSFSKNSKIYSFIERLKLYK